VLALAAVAVAAGAAAGARAHAVDAPGASGWSGAAGVALIAVSVLLGTTALAGPGAACLVGAWAVSYSGTPTGIDAAGVLGALACLAAAELAAWSVEARDGALPPRLAVVHVSSVASVAIGGGTVALLLVTAADDVDIGGSAVGGEALGVVAAMATVAVVSILAGRASARSR
jgi:hypothetical protein